MADCAIAAWDAKYLYELWRPITAIRLASTDGNPDTAEQADWTPLLITPPYPEYIAGHPTVSGAAQRVLTIYFGNNARPVAMLLDCGRKRRQIEPFCLGDCVRLEDVCDHYFICQGQAFC